MDFEAVKTWIESNKMLAVGIGVLAVGAIAFVVTKSQGGSSRRVSSGLSGMGKPYRKRKVKKAVALIGLT